MDSYPTIYLLDHQGVIGEIFHGRPEPKKLEEAIANLLKRVEKAP